MGQKVPSQNMHKRALYEGWGDLIFPAQAFDWVSRNGANSLLIQGIELAEREGFEPPVRFPVHLISSQAPSTGLGHLSAFLESRFCALSRTKKSASKAADSSAKTPPVAGN